MKTLLVDTNIFLRSLLNDVPSQAKRANKIISDAKNGRIKLVTSQIILFEVIFSLSKFYKFSKEQVVKAIEHIIGSEYFNLESRLDFISALEIFRNNNLDFTDCFLVARSMHGNLGLATFDEKLKKYAKNC